MTANDTKSYLGYLNKSLDEYNNSYHRYIGKNSIHADYSALIEETESNHKVPKFKVDYKVRITKYKNIFQQSLHQKLVKKKIFVIDCVLKTNLWTYESKDLNGETIVRGFHEKYFLLSKL